MDYTNNENIKKYIFLTATQKIFEKYSANCSQNDCDITRYGYQNKMMYGERIYQLSFYSAIYDHNILCKYDTYNIQFQYTG